MTSRNKYIKTLDKFLDIMKSKSKPSFYENEKDQIAEDLITACKKADLYDELTQDPTFFQCLKEWKEEGFQVDIFSINIDIYNYRTAKQEIDEIEFNIDLLSKQVSVFNGSWARLDFKIYHLLSKTLKALEVENEKEN